MRAYAGLVGYAVAGLALAGACAGAWAEEGRVYTPGAFDRVEIDGAGQVRLVQGDRAEVFVGGDAQAQEAVEITLAGDVLQLSLPGAWKFWDPAKAQVEVRMKNVRRITMSGAADLVAPGAIRSPDLSVDISGAGLARFDDLHADKMKFVISGAGEGQLAGRVDELALSLSGRGKVTAGQLQVGKAHVSISGVGNADLWVTDDLRVDISGAGHVTYAGQPKVRQSISGLGSVDASDARRCTADAASAACRGAGSAP
jgi:hypothetical protein